MGDTTDRTRRELQDDLRARGLPLVLEAAVRRRALLGRTSAVLSGAAVAAWSVRIADLASERLMLPAELPDDTAPADWNDPWLVVFVIASLTLLAAPLVTWLVASLLPRIGARWRTGLGVATTVLTLAAAGTTLPAPLLVTVVVVVIAATYWGLGAIVVWASKRSLRELDTLGTMGSRVLPLLLLTFLFFFFNAEIWQVATKLDVARTVGTVAVITVLAIVLTFVNARDELQETIARVGEADAPPLRRAERLNVLLITVLVTMMQFTLVAVLVFVFFVGFGILAVPEATAQAWMGEAPTRLSGPLAQVPVSTALLKVCLVLAAFSGLNFVAGASADRTYRATFVEPVLHEVEDGLRVRAVYRARSSNSRPSTDGTPGSARTEA